MEDINSLLLNGAKEIRQCSEPGIEQAWLNTLGSRMERAAEAAPSARENEVKAIAHSLTDSGPLGESACPSFWKVVGYYERQATNS